MKKILALLLVLAMVLALCACGEDKKDPQGADTAAEETKTEGSSEEIIVSEGPGAEIPSGDPADQAPADQAPADPAPADQTSADQTPAVMSYAEYAAAEEDSPVVVETYVQDHQNWWNGEITVYAESPEADGTIGAYFIYRMACSEEDAAKLVPGQKIRVTGYKSEWNGEIEIIDASFELLEANPWIAQPLDIAEDWGTLNMNNHQNQLILLKDAVIVEYDESGAAFAYENPNEKTDDLYFKAAINGLTYTFCVESYLRGSDTEVYKAVENLKVGDTVDIVGFLYWYNGPNVHTTEITVK